MKSYVILTAQTVPELEERVCEYIAVGYMPSSGICVTNRNNNELLYAQAMVSVSDFGKSMKEAVGKML